MIARRDFNAMSESGRIGGLRREVNKTRRALPMRELMTQYGDLITQLMPCVLVSPDSLARFFPAESGMNSPVSFLTSTLAAKASASRFVRNPRLSV